MFWVVAWPVTVPRRQSPWPTSEATAIKQSTTVKQGNGSLILYLTSSHVYLCDTFVTRGTHLSVSAIYRLTYDQTSATDDSNGNRKHFCLRLTAALRPRRSTLKTETSTFQKRLETETTSMVDNSNLHPLSHRFPVIAQYWSNYRLWVVTGGASITLFNSSMHHLSTSNIGHIFLESRK